MEYLGCQQSLALVREWIALGSECGSFYVEGPSGAGKTLDSKSLTLIDALRTNFDQCGNIRPCHQTWQGGMETGKLTLSKQDSDIRQHIPLS